MIMLAILPSKRKGQLESRKRGIRRDMAKISILDIVPLRNKAGG